MLSPKRLRSWNIASNVLGNDIFNASQDLSLAVETVARVVSRDRTSYDTSNVSWSIRAELGEVLVKAGDGLVGDQVQRVVGQPGVLATYLCSPDCQRGINVYLARANAAIIAEDIIPVAKDVAYQIVSQRRCLKYLGKNINFEAKLTISIIVTVIRTIRVSITRVTRPRSVAGTIVISGANCGTRDRVARCRAQRDRDVVDDGSNIGAKGFARARGSSHLLADFETTIAAQDIVACKWSV